MNNKEKIWLSLETATERGSLALMNSNQVLAHWSGQKKISHSIELIKKIESLLRQAKICRNSLSFLVVISGPGSFTGLRVGIATAKAISLGLKIPLIGINTLKSMSLAVKDYKNLICLVEAAQNKIFYQQFSWSENHCYKPIEEPFITDYQYLSQRIKCLEELALVVTNKVYQQISEKKLFAGDSLKIENIEENHVLAVYSGMKAAETAENPEQDWPNVLPEYLQTAIIKKPN